MKSIVTEASSIAKAVEQGWTKAHKPTEFTVKVLEEPQYNFFGMTTRTAKVAIFFAEKPVQPRAEQQIRSDGQQRRPAARSTAHREVRESRHDTRKPVQQRQSGAAQGSSSHQPEHRGQSHPERPVRQERVDAAAVSEVPKGDSLKKRESQWRPEMADLARLWLNEIFTASGVMVPAFRVEVQQFHLRITFDGPVLADRDREKQLFASFATLFIETIKQKYRIGLRGHKVVLTHS